MFKIYAVCILVMSLQFFQRAESVHIGSEHDIDADELNHFLNWFNSYVSSRSKSFRGATLYLSKEDFKNNDLSMEEMKVINSIVQEEFLGKLRKLYVSKNRSRFGK